MAAPSDYNSLKERADQLEMIIDLAPDLIFRLDQGLRYVYVNQRVLEVTGLTRDEYIGKTNRELKMPEELCNLWNRIFLKVFKTGQPQEAEFTFPSTEVPMHYQMRVIPETASDGSVLTAVGISRDITEKKMAEAILIESEGRFQAMLEHMTSGVAVYQAVDGGEDFVFRAFNAAAERITRISRKEAVGNRLLILFPHMDKSGLLGAIQRVWRTGQEEHLQPFYYKDGIREGWRENHLYKLPSGEVVTLFDDITGEKEAEEASRKSESICRTIAENFPEGAVFVFDSDLRFQVVDGQVLAALGYRREDLEGKTILECTDEETCRILGQRYQRLLAGESLHFETSLRGRIFASDYVPIRDDHGKVLAGMVVSV